MSNNLCVTHWLPMCPSRQACFLRRRQVMNLKRPGRIVTECWSAGVGALELWGKVGLGEGFALADLPPLVTPETMGPVNFSGLSLADNAQDFARPPNYFGDGERILSTCLISGTP